MVSKRSLINTLKKDKKQLLLYIYEKDTKIFGAVSFFMDKFINKSHEYFQMEESVGKKVNNIEFIANIITFVGMSVSIILIFNQEGINIADIAVILIAMEMIFGNVRNIVNQIGDIYHNCSLLDDLLNFLNISEDIEEYKNTKSNSVIELDRVSFRYPSAITNSIDNITLRINRGERIAIVGENGAGKTSLLKIMSGLYYPTDGSVRIKSDCVKSCVTQNFAKYFLSLRENIGLSRLDDIDNDSRMDYVIKTIFDEQIRERFENGYDTQVGREFGGAEFSGGEWQKIAISRCFFRQGDLIFCDEPSSAIDPLYEVELLEKLNVLFGDSTCIIVTHRLTSIKYIDKIIYMEAGKIKEMGTHDELICQNGNYAKMFNIQREKYNAVSKKKIH